MNKKIGHKSQANRPEDAAYHERDKQRSPEFWRGNEDELGGITTSHSMSARVSGYLKGLPHWTCNIAPVVVCMVVWLSVTQGRGDKSIYLYFKNNKCRSVKVEALHLWVPINGWKFISVQQRSQTCKGVLSNRYPCIIFSSSALLTCFVCVLCIYWHFHALEAPPGKFKWSCKLR